MRKLKLQMQLSVDGYVAGPNGEMDWMRWDWGEDISAYVKALCENTDTILLGRKLAEGFIPHWEQMQANTETADAASKFMTATPKIVFTKTVKNTQWNATTLATGNLTEEINRLKNSDGGDIIAYGGGGFASSLINTGLIDEYFLFINPTALGKGMPIFEGLGQKLSLTLAEAKAFKCGVAVLHYNKAQ